MESLFSDKKSHYKTIFEHYRKWCKEDVWKS
ncbi:hypothetical protein [Formosa sp. PL04]|nr:hypothetical protein [Formosa sp. PL04]MDW5289150.1 hypothetical protein [Formosa sp. PL04]